MQNQTAQDQLEDTTTVDELAQAREAKQNLATAGEEQTNEKEPVEYKPTDPKIIEALRNFADSLEKGEIQGVEHMVLLPKLHVSGDVPFMYLGDPIPQLYLQGMMHRVLTRMAFM